LVGPNVKIFDSDFHSVYPPERTDGMKNVNSKPITIGKEVFMGTGSMILKGVKIGDNSVICAGSILFTKIPDNAIAGGNPAKVLFYLKNN
jgi:acetyltransferase-like isoleucine patch superfamily enzyme